jgi:RHH-type proline utilization regulon transcriptional repressor/proline dehydrogenase/delta 1-pyrroline-5-carboxylate dehydrogenase
MLGEGARTADDAARYEAAYARALGAIADIGAGRDGPENGHGISVKLSALSPRYEPLQEERVWGELYPRLLRLARRAADADINMTLDAEEADRLVLSLTLLDRLAGESVLGSWRGLGLAVQAYQTRAVHVIDRLAELARATGRRLMVRLVKGAYWDSEIKRAQVAGRTGYPVFTTKPATDLSYLICASRLIVAAPALHAQFATHNGHTLASVRAMAVRRGVQVEYQRLHGMGEALYAAARDLFGPMRVRTYAPVGAHEDLLPYLVRRLLENGANTGFVHQLLNDDVPPEDVVADPFTAVEAAGAQGHPRLPLPVDLYGDRRNSLGVDMSVASERARLVAAVRDFRPEPEDGAAVLAPATGMVVGHIAEATAAQIDAAFAAARAAQAAWDGLGGPGRATVLERMADALEGARERLIALCVLEAGKTYGDAIAEVREAADFCRYYALLARRQFAGEEELKGPAGERNFLSRHGRGVFVCISPWNFPLAIFTGQLAAALAAGNAVLAKPAGQTPLVAREAVRLFHGAGLPREVLHLVPGDGRVGERLVTHQGCDGLAFTGGTETARRINRLLAERPGPIVPFIAETGGLNAAFVDTSAQREQVLDDVMLSAFGSAGQRCSALRLLFLPHETADHMIEGLKGAMATLVVGDPAHPGTDVGPVIDAGARDRLERHLELLAREAKILHRLPAPATGTFFAPVLAEIASARFLTREVFGPILHVVRYDPRQAETVARDFAGNGYGLTLGIHSRVESFAETIRRAVPAGNTYVNRSIIGAVVGVQPFGGEGLSGTGPKAGGPLALSRYCVERALSINIAARGGDPALLNL